MRDRKWREPAREIIRRTVEATLPSLTGTHVHDEVLLRMALDRVYPFGARQYTPYRVWQEEVRAVLNAYFHVSSPISRGDTTKLAAWNNAAKSWSKENA